MLLLKVPLAIVPPRLMPQVKPPFDAEGSCGYGATSLMPLVMSPAVAELSCSYGATSIVPNTVSHIDDAYTQLQFFQSYLIKTIHLIASIYLLDITEINWKVFSLICILAIVLNEFGKVVKTSFNTILFHANSDSCLLFLSCVLKKT